MGVNFQVRLKNDSQKLITIQLFNVLDMRREVKVLDSGTSGDNLFCFVQIKDELVKDSPVSGVIKFDINTISMLGD